MKLEREYSDQLKKVEFWSQKRPKAHSLNYELLVALF